MVAAGSASYFYLLAKLGDIGRTTVSALSPARAGRPQDVLLVASDPSTCPQGAAASGPGRSGVAGQHFDVIVLTRLLGRGRVELLSIPGDTYLRLAGTHRSARISSTLGNGPDQLVRALEADLHVPVNHLVMLDLCALPAMVEALGALHLDFPDPLRDTASGLDVRRTGCQLVNGSEALALVRSRHLYYFSGGSWSYDSMGALSVVERQQDVLRAALDRLRSVLPNVLRLNAFAGTMASALVVDSRWSSSDIMAIGWDYRSLSDSNLTVTLLPTTPSVIRGEDVRTPAGPQDRALISRWMAGDAGGAGSALPGTASGPHAGLLGGRVVGEPKESWNPSPC